MENNKTLGEVVKKEFENIYRQGCKDTAEKIYKEYFSNNTFLDSITVEKLKDKARYVEAQYYASFDKVRQKLTFMKQQYNKLQPIQIPHYSPTQ